MICHTHEVERRVDLDVVAQRMLDGLALRVLVRIARPGYAVAEYPRVHRPARVDMRFAEVRVPIGIRLRACSRCRGGPARSSRAAGSGRRAGLSRLLLWLRAGDRGEHAAHEHDRYDAGSDLHSMPSCANASTQCVLTTPPPDPLLLKTKS